MDAVKLMYLVGKCESYEMKTYPWPPLCACWFCHYFQAQSFFLPPPSFRDPSAFDVLANIGADKRFSMSQSRLARDSLYVKFDPLMSSGSAQTSSSALTPAADASAAMPPPTAIPRERPDASPPRDFDSPRESMILIGTPPAKHKVN